MLRQWKGWLVVGMSLCLLACRMEQLVAAQGDAAGSTARKSTAAARVLRVGPGKQYAAPSQAAAVAQDGDVIELDPVVYEKDAAIWRANNLTIRGVGGRAHLQAKWAAAEGKGIWVIKGNNTTVEHIEFSGADVSDGNGAGIRQEGTGLTIRFCYFHHNQMGILTGENLHSDILIEHSEFAWSDRKGSPAHNIYIGEVRSFTLQHSYSHHASVGHLVKSRARTNFILYNRLAEEADGDSSYNIDLSNGGVSYIIGNIIQQSPATENWGMLAHAAEGPKHPQQELYVINNTFVNDKESGGVFVQVKGTPTGLKVLNNVFVGKGEIVSGGKTPPNNLVTSKPGFLDRSNVNYHLTTASPAIDAGVAPGTANGVDLTPVWQHVYPTGKEARTVVGKALDAGAYEFGLPGTATKPLFPPTNVRITTLSPSQVKLTWQGSPESSSVVKAYKLYRNDTEITSTPSPTYTDTGLAAYTSYTYKVVAYDDKGFTSEASAAVQVTTPRVLEKAKPTTPGWYELAKTALRPVCATEPAIQGWTGCNSVVAAWNSAVLDSKRNRLVLWGGGGSDYYGNEMYALNLDTYTMERLTAPGLPAANPEVCDEAIVQGTQPNSRHTYDGITYMANIDRMFVFSGKLSCKAGDWSGGTWTFNFATKQWQRMQPKGPQPGGGPGKIAVYDAATGKVLVHDQQHLFAYDFATDTYTRISTEPISADWRMTGVIDPKRRQFVMLGGQKGWSYDLSQPTTSKPQVLTTQGGEAIVEAFYPGLAYHAALGRIVAWHGGDTAYSLDLDTKRWTPHTWPGGPGSANANGTYKRWNYAPALDALVVLNHYDANAYLLRLADK